MLRKPDSTGQSENFYSDINSTYIFVGRNPKTCKVVASPYLLLVENSDVDAQEAQTISKSVLAWVLYCDA